MKGEHRIMVGALIRGLMESNDNEWYQVLQEILSQYQKHRPGLYTKIVNSRDC